MLKLLVKSDQYAFRLYRPGGELPETLPEHRVDGYRCIGHYTTIRTLIQGARDFLAKDRSKRALELRDFLDRSAESDRATLTALENLADAAAAQEVKPS